MLIRQARPGRYTFRALAKQNAVACLQPSTPCQAAGSRTERPFRCHTDDQRGRHRRVHIGGSARAYEILGQSQPVGPVHRRAASDLNKLLCSAIPADDHAMTTRGGFPATDTREHARIEACGRASWIPVSARWRWRSPPARARSSCSSPAATPRRPRRGPSDDDSPHR